MISRLIGHLQAVMLSIHPPLPTPSSNLAVDGLFRRAVIDLRRLAGSLCASRVQLEGVALVVGGAAATRQQEGEHGAAGKGGEAAHPGEDTPLEGEFRSPGSGGGSNRSAISTQYVFRRSAGHV